jgi:choice-of-anchor B domain-containing protein
VGEAATAAAAGFTWWISRTPSSHFSWAKLRIYAYDATLRHLQRRHANYLGSEIVFAPNEDTITVVDVSVKASPVQLSRTTYASSGYTHQGWLSEDQSTDFFGDETDECRINTKTFVMDVQDLNNPFWPVSTGPTLPLTTLRKRRLCLSATLPCRSSTVLKINDLSSASFSEIGFDILPSSDRPILMVLSVYPFLASGNVMCGIEQACLCFARTRLCRAGLRRERSLQRRRRLQQLS